MLAPKKSKYRKQFRDNIKGRATSGYRLAFGEFGLKSLGSGWFAANQIEAARKTISNFTKRGGKIWVRIFPDKPVTKKAAGVRMGGGKGDIEKYVAVIRPGRILFELGGLEEKIAQEALRRAADKIPFPTKIIKKE